MTKCLLEGCTKDAPGKKKYCSEKCRRAAARARQKENKAKKDTKPDLEEEVAESENTGVDVEELKRLISDLFTPKEVIWHHTEKLNVVSTNPIPNTVAEIASICKSAVEAEMGTWPLAGQCVIDLCKVTDVIGAYSKELMAFKVNVVPLWVASVDACLTEKPACANPVSVFSLEIAKTMAHELLHSCGLEDGDSMDELMEAIPVQLFRENKMPVLTLEKEDWLKAIVSLTYDWLAEAGRKDLNRVIDSGMAYISDTTTIKTTRTWVRHMFKQVDDNRWDESEKKTKVTGTEAAPTFGPAVPAHQQSAISVVRMTEIGEAVYRRLAFHLMKVSGFNPGSIDNVWANPRGVIDYPVNILDLDDGELFTHYGIQLETSKVPKEILGGNIIGTMLKRGTIPAYVLYFKFGGNIKQRIIMPVGTTGASQWAKNYLAGWPSVYVLDGDRQIKDPSVKYKYVIYTDASNPGRNENECGVIVAPFKRDTRQHNSHLIR